MTYDVAFRHQQALDPSALSTIGASLHAIGAAVNDCRNAGVDAESDPAVVLLVRHLARVTEDRPDTMVLRRACMDRIAALRRFPALQVLAIRGVAYDEPAKARFHADGRAAMRRLADALGLDPSRYDIRSNRAGPAVSGEITLHGEELWVQLSLGAMGPDNEVCYRRVRDRHDHCGERNHWASLRALLAPDRFAVTLRKDLGLSPAATEPIRLFA